MKKKIKIFFCFSIFLLSGILYNIAEAQTYSMDFKDTSTYRKTCGDITPDHWKVKNETCTLSTPILQANGVDSIWVRFNLKVNQSGNLTYSDTMHFRHKINQRSWTHDRTFHGDGTNNVFEFVDSVRMKNRDTVKFEMIGFTSSNSKFWQIKNGEFSVLNVVMVGATLPIELESFDVSSVDNYIILEWATYSETNNDYFTIERSKDAIAFEPVITIDGAGNSIGLISYSAVDATPLPGLSYYRLKQTDYNGAYKYFPTKTVRIDCIEACIRIDQNTRTLSIFTNICGLTFSLFDMEGNAIVITKMNGNMISISNLASGIYVLTLRNDKFIQTKKVVIN
ncbi:MAG: T9SS type A sorting domain-containing protein [Bacteroidales bacterium]|jgi:hypothetical protein